MVIYESRKVQKYRLIAWTLNKISTVFWNLLTTFWISESQSPHPPKKMTMQASTSPLHGQCHLSSLAFFILGHTLSSGILAIYIFCWEKSVRVPSTFHKAFHDMNGQNRTASLFSMAFWILIIWCNRITFLCSLPTLHWTPAQQGGGHHLISVFTAPIPH